MKDRDQEYKEIFKAEALQEWDYVNTLLVELEKSPRDEKALAEIFRLFHNLKANARAIGYKSLSELAHKVETVFSLIREGQIEFRDEVSRLIFLVQDLIAEILKNLDDPEKVTGVKDLIDHLELLATNKRILAEGGMRITGITSQKVILSDLIYIPVKKLDELLNLLGELIIDRDRISAIADETENIELSQVSAHLERITKELQYNIMDARLVAIGALFNKMPKIVRDISVAENKKIDLRISGEDILVDRNILQTITDSLIHLIRNAIDHGIESPEKRTNQNKSETGTISISAHSDKDLVAIEISDDGNGIDIEKVKTKVIEGKFTSAERIKNMRKAELLSFIFEPGFSLASNVTELSGRGVGLDIVKNTVDAIGGKIEIETEEKKGTTFRLIIPNSMALTGALLFEVLNVPYAIPLIHTESVSHIPTSHLHFVGKSAFIEINNETIPVLYLREFFNSGMYRVSELLLSEQPTQNLIIVSYNNRKLGLIVDKLIRQQHVVVKPLLEPIADIDLYSGVTQLGNGQICLVLDIPAMSRQFSTKLNVEEKTDSL